MGGTTDHNRANNARVDYVFYRSNNTYCRVHPGTKRKNDAQLNIASTSTCSRTVQADDVAPNSANPRDRQDGESESVATTQPTRGSRIRCYRTRSFQMMAVSLKSWR